MIKNVKLKGLLATAISAVMFVSSANAADEAMHPKRNDYTSAGIFGKFDIPSLQRGFQVYVEVCAACHSMDLVAFRTLEDIGYNEDEIKAIAVETMVSRRSGLVFLLITSQHLLPMRIRRVLLMVARYHLTSLP